jgi:hypothetical protein
MSLQTLIVCFIVACCTLHAAWTLMPGSARASLASSLLRLPLPSPIARRLQKATRAGAGCGGCDSCGSAKPAATTGATTTKPITIHRRPR